MPSFLNFETPGPSFFSSYYTLTGGVFRLEPRVLSFASSSPSKPISSSGMSSMFVTSNCFMNSSTFYPFLSILTKNFCACDLA